MCLACIRGVLLIMYYIYIFLHFSEGASPSRVPGAPALALPEKCEKIKPFMQTNVRLPPDTLAVASQQARRADHACLGDSQPG